MPTSTLTPQGQVTIPAEIREQLGLADEIRLHIEVDADGQIVLVPEESARENSSPEGFAGRSSTPEDGLAGLVGLWDDGEEFAAEVERVVADRTPPRPLDDIE